MNELFNSKVICAQPVRRPLGSSAGGLVSRFTAHSGTMVTLANGSNYLIHHGDGYAAEGHNPTVITPAENMKGVWTGVGNSYDPNCNVGRMMGNEHPYKLDGNNCHDITASHPNATVRVQSIGGLSIDIVPK